MFKLMRKTLVLAALFLGILSGKAQEKVMNVLKTDGTSSRTRVADLKQINFLTVDEGDEMMLERYNNGALFRTKVNEVEEVTVADTTYNFNSTGYRILEAEDVC